MPLVNFAGRFDVTLGSGPSVPPPAKKYAGWRGLHMAESVNARVIPYSMPAVMPPIDQNALEMTEAIQLMSFALMKHFYPAITGNVWRNLHMVGLCLNNKDVDGFDGDIVHADYVNKRDLGASLPRYDKQQRTFEGTFIRGELVGDRIRCVPGIHGIDAKKPMPSVEEIVEKNWYVTAVNVGPERNPVPSHFAQGKGFPIVYPFIFDRVIEFPAIWFERWESEELPNPVRLYQ